MQTRREVLEYMAMAAAGFAAAGRTPAAETGLDILFLGGTGFLGPHTVRAALSRNHSVTLFNRGRTNPGLFPELETIVGDRNSPDIRQLARRRWDAVVDTSAYFPRSVNMAADVLEGSIGQYVLISTISVYDTWSTPDMDESASVRKIADPTIEEIRQPATYGALKALCEDAANARMPGRVTGIRPGFLVGPGDETDRFTYWPVRISRGGEVLAPGSGGDYAQFIDVRDLADWIIHCIEMNVLGTFNAHNKARELTMFEWLMSCREILNDSAELTWVDARFLESHRVTPQVDMPIWLPGGMALSAERAHRNGLELRPLDETVRATFEWFSGLPRERQNSLRAGIATEREARVLSEWHAERGFTRRSI